MDEDWKFEKQKGACDACKAPFPPGQDYLAALAAQGSAFARREYCLACWPAQAADAFYSYWRTRLPAPDAPKRANADAAAETLAKLLAEPALEPSRRRLAFLLSLILMQRRRLKLVETVTRDGTEVLRLERAEDGTVIEVANPGVPDAELDSLKGEIEALMR